MYVANKLHFLLAKTFSTEDALIFEMDSKLMSDGMKCAWMLQN